MLVLAMRLGVEGIDIERLIIAGFCYLTLTRKGIIFCRLDFVIYFFQIMIGKVLLVQWSKSGLLGEDKELQASLVVKHVNHSFLLVSK